MDDPLEQQRYGEEKNDYETRHNCEVCEEHCPEVFIETVWGHACLGERRIYSEYTSAQEFAMRLKLKQEKHYGIKIRKSGSSWVVEWSNR